MDLSVAPAHELHKGSSGDEGEPRNWHALRPVVDCSYTVFDREDAPALGLSQQIVEELRVLTLFCSILFTRVEEIAFFLHQIVLGHEFLINFLGLLHVFTEHNGLVVSLHLFEYELEDCRTIVLKEYNIAFSLGVILSGHIIEYITIIIEPEPFFDELTVDCRAAAIHRLASLEEFNSFESLILFMVIRACQVSFINEKTHIFNRLTRFSSITEKSNSLMTRNCDTCRKFVGLLQDIS